MSNLKQQKLTASGQVRRWDLDLAAMQRTAEWAQDVPHLLGEEFSALLEQFPTLIAAVGTPLSEKRCWVEAAEPYSPPSGGLVVFDQGLRDVETGQAVEAPEGAMVGFIVRIPSPLSGRPFEERVLERLARVEAQDPERAKIWKQALITVKGRLYLAPRFGVWFSQSHPHADPPVMVWPEYFEMLDIPADHVYFADEYYRLCLFATWREQPVVQVLQNRVVPRLLIDLLVADLQAAGKFEEALTRLDLSLYEMYNVVGRPNLVGPLKEVYRDLVGREFNT